jgi:hypothetical protein
MLLWRDSFDPCESIELVFNRRNSSPSYDSASPMNHDLRFPMLGIVHLMIACYSVRLSSAVLALTP